VSEGAVTVSTALQRLQGLEKGARTGAAVESWLVDYAASLPDASAHFVTLKAGLKVLGIAVTDWVRVVRDARRRRALSAERLDPTVILDARPMINLTTLEEFEVNERAAKAISRLPNLYQRHGALVRVLEATRRRPGEAKPYAVTEVREVSEPLLRELFTRAARWGEFTLGADGESSFERAHPPEWAVRAVAKWQAWPDVRPLYHVAEVPVLLPNGDIISRDGYDEATGILYRPKLKIPEIPERPTQADAAAAAARILDVVCDVPFEDGARRSAFFASLLTPIARWAFAGQTPFFLFDANQAGSGKGLMQLIIGWIVLGHPMDFTVQTDDEDEERKRLTSKVMSGVPMLVVDNIDKPFGSPVLDALLTSGTWADRLLGSNEAPSFDTWIICYGSGNNVTFKRDDMRRRTCVVRLQTDQIRPEERANFKHGNLQDGTYVLARRAELFADCLIVLRAWLRSGQRPTDLPGWGGTWGSFDGWDSVVRGAVVYAGLPDPIAAKATANTAEAASEGLLKLLEGWAEVGESSAASVFDHLKENDEWRRGDKQVAVRWKRLREAFGGLIGRNQAGGLPSVQQIGNMLARYKGKPVATPLGPRRLMVRVLDGTNLWRVEPVPEAPAVADPAPIEPDPDIERAAITAEPAAEPCASCGQRDCACGRCGRCRNTDPAREGCCC